MSQTVRMDFAVVNRLGEITLTASHRDIAEHHAAHLGEGFKVCRRIVTTTLAPVEALNQRRTAA